jgi:hypothetical protein
MGGDIPMANGGLKSPIENTKELLKLFWLERYAFLTLSIVAGALVVYAGFEAIHETNNGNRASAVGLFFGSGGVATYSIGRLLVMVNKVTEIAMRFAGRS